MKNISGNLSLVHLLGGYQKTFVQLLLVSIVAICLLIFPLFNLWFLQAKFLPFHDTDYTNWQCLIVVIDCLMLLVLLPKILDKNDNAWQWWTSIISPVFLINRAYLILIKSICRLLYILNGLFLLFLHRFFYQPRFAGFRSVVINISSNLTTTIHNSQSRYHAVLLIRIISIKHFLATGLLFGFLVSIFILSVFVSTLPQFQKYEEVKIETTKKNQFIVNLFQSIDLFINDREKWLLNDIPECKHKYNYIQNIIYFCKVQVGQYSFNEKINRYSLSLTDFFHEKTSDNRNFLSRNLNLSEKVITSDEHLSHELENTIDKNTSLEKITGIDLKERDLRYANFSLAKLPKADLRKAILNGANLKDAQLEGANLYLAQLQGVNLTNAKLKRDNLYSTELQGANLELANLQFTNLEFANMQDANLISTKLQNANLHFAQLQNAKLYSAELQDAYLVGTVFQNSYLGDVKFQGANLHLAKLQGTNLRQAKLQGTNLRQANLQGANLSHANLQGADLSSSELQGADLSFAQLQGSNLSYARLQGSNLMSVSYGEYIDQKTKETKLTNFRISYRYVADINCLTDDYNLPICKKYDEKDTQNLNKVTAYWVNDLACSDKLIAQSIIENYLSYGDEDDRFKNYLIPLLNKKLSDKTCLGIQELPDKVKQQIILANKPTNKN
ncbi:MAG: pentapeptide repeat-containing protein [Methylococcales bacterium]|nr:pentapeptide repeat-containing protein [Methylococcales bacterium]